MTGLSAPQPHPEADAPWAAWVEKGVQHDRVAHRRALTIAALLGIALVVWLVAALLR